MNKCSIYKWSLGGDEWMDRQSCVIPYMCDMTCSQHTAQRYCYRNVINTF